MWWRFSNGSRTQSYGLNFPAAPYYFTAPGPPQAWGSKTSIRTSYKMSHARVINLGYLFINFKHIKEKTLVFRCFVCLVTPILCSLPKSSGCSVFHAPSHHRGHRGPGARGNCSVKDIFPEINQIAYFGTVIGDISVYRTENKRLITNVRSLQNSLCKKPLGDDQRIQGVLTCGKK